jgi:hypothetical protein
VIWHKGVWRKRLVVPSRIHLQLPRRLRTSTAAILLFTLALFTLTAVPSQAKKDTVHYGTGLIVNIPLPEPEVALAVQDVAENTIIRGTKEYSRDEFVKGAAAATSAPGFAAWKQGGKIFYKVKKQALDPLNFQEGGDLGTLAVRYVVLPQGEKNTVLRIDAVFVDDAHHSVRGSNGSVESSEYQNIQAHLASAELVKKETAEVLELKEQRAARQKSSTAGNGLSSAPSPESSSLANAGEQTRVEPAPSLPPQQLPTYPTSLAPPQSVYEKPNETLEQRVARLRKEVERLVKTPGAPLQSAPFHTATTLKSLDPGTEVLILISTPYWYGVETRDGQHGWIRRDDLEQMP